jgi:hypothetical protein
VFGPGPEKSGRKLQESEFSKKKVTELFTADRFQSGKIMVFWPPVSKQMP